MRLNDDLYPSEGDMDIARRITAVLAELGIRRHLKGFGMVRYAIFLTYGNGNPLPVTKIIYPMVARKFSTTPIRVERNIRTAVTDAFGHRENRDAFGKYFRRGCPINSDFIATIADEI